MNEPLVIIGGGALAYAAYQSRVAGNEHAPAVPPPTKQPLPGANMSTPVRIKTAALADDRFARLFAVGGGIPVRGGAAVTGGGGNYVDQAELAARQKLKELEEQAKAEYEKLSAAARKEGAKQLNEELGTNLTGDESWEEASRQVGAAVGSAGGTAACTAIPYVGTLVAATGVCAVLGSMAGAYLGEKIGPWAKEAWSDIKSGADKAWEATKGAVDDSITAVGDAAEEVGDFLKFW